MDTSSLLTLDYIVIGVVLISTLLAFFSGFVHSILSFAGWIAAFFIAYYGLPYAKPWVSQKIQEDVIANIVSFMGLFLISLIVIAIFNYQITRIVKESRLGPLDRTLGAMFGAARGALIVGVAFIIIHLSLIILGTNVKNEKELEEAKVNTLPELKDDVAWLNHAKTYKVLTDASNVILRFFPQDRWKEVQSFALDYAKPNKGDEWHPKTPEVGAFADVLKDLPPETRQSLFRQYQKEKEKGTTPVPELQVKFSRQVLAAYKDAMQNNKVQSDFRISSDELQLIETMVKRINTKTATKEAGYNEKQLKEMDRLIEGIQ